jgi:TPP-dependent pyruvate/acetoin dehydrogenase alpha subunit
VLTDDVKLQLFRLMSRSRAFEELAKLQVLAGNIRSSWMSGKGQEGIIGALAQLHQDDYLTYTHRGAYAFIARGSDPARLLAELFGRVDGYCKGKGGRHIADLSHGIYGKSGTIGAHATLAVGMGIAAQIRNSKQVVLSVFGDGTANRGTTHSSMAASVVKKLPVVWLCENNNYAGAMNGKDYNPFESMDVLAEAYGMPGFSIDGNDVLEVYARAAAAIARARAGMGPSLIELNTYRVEPFAIGMPESRDEDELALWTDRDPLVAFRELLLESGILTESMLNDLQQEIDDEMNAALAFAEASDYPQPDDAFEDLYSP